MRGRARTAGAAVAACAAAVLLVAGAVSAPAAGPRVVDYQAGGQARGVDVSFTFKGSLFKRLVDLGIPAATSDVASEAGGAARGTASQAFPGEVVIGSVGESFPGYRQALYPPSEADPGPVDEAHAVTPCAPRSTTACVPGVIEAGPLALETGRLRASASANEASGLVTTNRVSFGEAAPFIKVRHLEATSESTREADHVVHVARAVARDVQIAVSDDLAVSIGEIVSIAQTTSDGETPTAETSLALSDVVVTMMGESYKARIDTEGIHLEGKELPPQVPPFVPQDLGQALELLLDQANVRIAVGPAAETVEDVTADASVGGLVVSLEGTIPNVFIPQAVTEIVADVEQNPAMPQVVRDLLDRSICYVEDVKPLLPEQLTENLPDLPICVSPQIIPGPGGGAITTFSISAVRSTSAAVREEPFVEPPPTDGGTDGGFVPPTDGGFTDGGFPGGGAPPPAPGTGGGAVTTPRLFGLVARLPSAALLGTGAVFLALAMGLSFGPSLRRWRTGAP